MKRILTAILFLALAFLTNPLSTLAQDSQSDSYRLQQIEKLSATASTKTATTAAKAKSASITFSEGSVLAVNSKTIFLVTEDGTKTVYTTDTTKFYNIDASGKKLIGVGDLKAADKILVIGLPSLSNQGSAKIIVRDQTKAIENISLIGKITEISTTTLKIGSITRTDLPTLTTTLNSDSLVTNARKQSLKLAELMVNDQIAAAGYFDEKNNFTVKQIFKISSPTSNSATASAK